MKKLLKGTAVFVVGVFTGFMACCGVLGWGFADSKHQHEDAECTVSSLFTNNNKVQLSLTTWKDEYLDELRTKVEANES